MGAPTVNPEVKQVIRTNFSGSYILSGGYNDVTQAEQDLQAKKGELVAFGRPFIGNPDLVERLKAGKKLQDADPTKFYTPGPDGYTTYSKAE